MARWVANRKASDQQIALMVRSQNGRAIGVWVISLVFVLFQFFLQLSSAEIVGGLMHSFSLSAFGAGVLASVYYYVYVMLQTPAGMFVDRYGTRKLLTGGALGVAFGCLLFATSDNLLLAGLGRLIMGTGAAFAFVGSMNIAGRWFPAERFTLLAALAETIGMIGSIIGSLFLANSVHIFGWRHCILFAAFLAAIIAVLLWVIVRDRPQGQVVEKNLHSFKSIYIDLLSIFKNKYAWINGIYSGLMFAVVTVFVALWAIPYFQVAHQISLVAATFLGSMVFAGVAIGSLLFGWLDVFLPRRLLFVTSALVAAGLLLILILMPKLSLLLSAIIMALLGVCISSYVLTFGVANEIVPPSMRSTSIGFVNTLSVGTAPLFQPLVGLVLTKVALAHHALSHSQYSVSDYQSALLLIPLMCLIAAVLGFFMPERKRH